MGCVYNTACLDMYILYVIYMHILMYINAHTCTHVNPQTYTHTHTYSHIQSVLKVCAGVIQIYVVLVGKLFLPLFLVSLAVSGSLSLSLYRFLVRSCAHACAQPCLSVQKTIRMMIGSLCKKQQTFVHGCQLEQSQW